MATSILSSQCLEWPSSSNSRVIVSNNRFVKLRMPRPSINHPLRLSSNPPLLLLDFDSTLTTTSTLFSLLSLPTTIYRSRHPGSRSNTPPPLTAAQLSAAYAFDLKAHESSYSREKAERKDLHQELLYQISCRNLEAASFARGQQAFSVAGVTKSEIHSAALKALSAGEVVFRKGWQRLLSVAARKGKIGIISTNWSQTWIESLIEIAARREGLVNNEGFLVLDGKGVCRPAGKKLEIEVWSNGVISQADEIARKDDGVPSGIRGGGLGDEGASAREEEVHDGSLLEDSAPRTNKRRKLKGSIDLTQPLILSPKARRTLQDVGQSSSLPTYTAGEDSDGSSTLSSIADSDLEDSNRSDGSISNDVPRTSRIADEDPNEDSQTSSTLDSESEDFNHSDGHIFTAVDKALVLDSMIKTFEKQIADSPAMYPAKKSKDWGSAFFSFMTGIETPVNTIYIGDSPGDLEPLMAADTGIIIRDEGKLEGEELELEKTLGRLGIVTARIGKIKDERDKMNENVPRLWWAQDFDEVLDTGIFGIEE